MLAIIKNRKITFILSGILVLASALALFRFGLKPGIDFTGGSLLEVKFSQERPDIADARATLFAVDVGEVLAQTSGPDTMLLRMRFLTEDEHQKILSLLRDSYGPEGETAPSVLEERFETIGPAISANLKDRAAYAAGAVVLAMILYIAYAFRKVSKPVESWKYGVAAIIALLHDVVITMGAFSLLGYFAGVEVGIPFVVALLTIMGYSVNDTIVVFDRVRENLIKRGSDDFAETVNLGVNQSIIRSINMSLTTLLVLFALFFFGGESIHYFSLALIIGIAVGTYSSIFLASPLLVVWARFKK